jgi:hypothetical protein
LNAVQKSRIAIRSCSGKLRAEALFHAAILNLWPTKEEFEICCRPEVYKRVTIARDNAVEVLSGQRARERANCSSALHTPPPANAKNRKTKQNNMAS